MPPCSSQAFTHSIAYLTGFCKRGEGACQCRGALKTGKNEAVHGLGEVHGPPAAVLEPVFIGGGCRRGEGFCRPARQKIVGILGLV